jgi:thiamine-phosphate pyrophosphorylase
MLPRLHIVTDDEILAAPDFASSAARLVSEFGDRIAVHLRSRIASGRMLYDLTCALQTANAFVLVNERIDVAMAAGAVGVQLPATALPVPVARLLFAAGQIGKSVHSAAAGSSAAREGADFLVAGSIYASASHPMATPRGIPLIGRLRDAGVPVIAIGGIDAARAPECRLAGAYGVAVIRAVWRAPDPVIAAAELLQRVEESVTRS